MTPVATLHLTMRTAKGYMHSPSETALAGSNPASSTKFDAGLPGTDQSLISSERRVQLSLPQPSLGRTGTGYMFI